MIERLVAEGDGDTLKRRRTTTSGEDLEHLGQYKQIGVQWVVWFDFVLLLIFHNRKQEAAGGVVGGGVLGLA